MIDLPLTFEIDGAFYLRNSWGGVSQVNALPFEYKDEYLNHYRKFDPAIVKRLEGLKWNMITGIQSNIESVLDFGFGAGNFLNYIKGKTRAIGYDVIPPPLESVFFEIATSPLFPVEVVTMWDVLEHLQTFEILKELECRFLAVSVPNCTVENVEKFTEWKHRKPNEHLHHFDIKSLKTLLHEYGYDLLTYNYDQDEVRKPDALSCAPNILQAVFKKRT